VKLAFVIRPSRVWISSISARPRPCAVPPSIWPSTACGLTAKARREEELLAARFPAYADYASRTRHRFVPGLI
jgi:protein-S-isoprenylcysteine O-methyltransferase Ste14